MTNESRPLFVILTCVLVFGVTTGWVPTVHAGSPVDGGRCRNGTKAYKGKVTFYCSSGQWRRDYGSLCDNFRGKCRAGGRCKKAIKSYYCVDDGSKCGWPGSRGVRPFDFRTYNGKTYICAPVQEGGRMKLSTGSLNVGTGCTKHSQCKSKYCWYLPRHQRNAMFGGKREPKACTRNATCPWLGSNGFAPGAVKKVQVSGQYMEFKCGSDRRWKLLPGTICGRQFEPCLGYCRPGLDGKSYCTATQNQCAEKGRRGASPKQTKSHNGKLYVCTSQYGWRLRDGQSCDRHSMCGSRKCLPNIANTGKFCVSGAMTCPAIGRPGAKVGETKRYGSKVYKCQRNGAWARRR